MTFLQNLTWPSWLVRDASAQATKARIEMIHYEGLTKRALTVRLPRGTALDTDGSVLVRLDGELGERRIPAVRLSPTRLRLHVEVRKHNLFDDALAFRTRVGDRLLLQA